MRSCASSTCRFKGCPSTSASGSSSSSSVSPSKAALFLPERVGGEMKIIQKAWGHTTHRDSARLLLDRARDLITQGPAHRGANGAAMPTNEDHFFYNHPERGGYSAA